ncbi:unnamed protein product [Mytilus coruscus]|uniref:SMP-30/Gluconolactonase/LRE-like region domain-containing protein n=1 Tax=Mytilus coruscus TaxID=42192 RepID=A0A6J8DG88_MYTCO|nr:unnamed protein product [Mytilus coruscus]
MKGRRENVNFRSGDIKILHKIYASESGATSAIFIGDYLVIVSYSKSNVAKYSLDGKLEQLLTVEKYPRDIAQVDQTQVAIAIYNRNKIVFVDIAEMRLFRTLDLSGIPEYGLCCVEGNTFIISHGSTLTWVNSSGMQLKQKSIEGESYYVSTSDMKDCIYGDGDNSVSSVEGYTTKFTYTNTQLISPRGIGIDFEGNIYIAGFGSKNIHQITNDGKLIRIIPIGTFGLQSPWTIHFAPNSNKFVVTCSASGKVGLCEMN